MTKRQPDPRACKNKPYHSALSQDQINELFIKAGWIGKRRLPVVFIKTPPHIEGNW